MKFIPFPPTLARISAETGRRLQSSDKDDAGRRRPRSALPQPYTANAVAAYRWPDGRVAPAHDMYAPQHPDGAEPGLARIHYEVRHHPNDTSSYEPKILTFRSVLDLEAEGMVVDRTAAGLLLHDLKAALVITPDEAAMSELETRAPEGSRILRAPLRRVGEGAGEMTHFLATNTSGGGFEVMGAASEADLFAAARERFSFLPEAPDYPAFCETLRKHGTKNGWVVAATTLEAIPENLRDYMGVELEAQVTVEGPGF
jgi:hypothetical protein